MEPLTVLRNFATALILIASIGRTVNAQITLTAADFAGPGQIEVKQELEPGTWNEGPAGVNLVWDFSSAIPNGNSPDTTFYLSALSTMYAADFPQANLALRFGAADVGYGYAIKNADSLALLGTGSSALWPEPIWSYNDPIVTARFPINYGGSFTDTWGYDRGPLDLGNGTFIEWRSEALSTYSIDAWGTLSVPGHGPAPALRMKLRYTKVDSTIYSGATNSVLVRRTAHTQYAWTTSGADGFDFNILYDSVWVDGSPDPQVDHRVSYSLREASGIGVPEEHRADVSLTPNPSSGHVLVGGTGWIGMVDLQVLATDGRVVRSGNLQLGAQPTPLDLSNLDPGSYSVVLRTVSDRRTIKLIIQR